MSTTTLLLLSGIVILLLLLGVAAWWNFDAYTEREREREQRAALEAWLHKNLGQIRYEVGNTYPAATSVCNSLETALPERFPVDLKGLKQHLDALQRNHNAALLDAAQVVPSAERVRDLLAQIAVAAGARGLGGIEAQACAAIRLLRNGVWSGQRQESGVRSPELVAGSSSAKEGAS